MAIRQPDVEQFESWMEGVRTSDGVFAVNMDHRIIYWSSGAKSILGYSSKDIVGRPCYEILEGRDGADYRFCRRTCPVMAGAQGGRTTPNYDLLVKAKDQSPVWINCSIMVSKSNHKGPPAVVHLFRDVTQRRQLEQRAQKATDALMQFLEESSLNETSNAGASPPPMPRLTRREQEVLGMLSLGLKTRQIAESLGVSPVTARNHISGLLRKLGVENRLQAVLFASQHRIV